MRVSPMYWKLLVVGRVHVGFVGVEPGGAPTDLPDFGEVGVVRH